MSQYISLEIESRAIVDLPSSEIIAHRSQYRQKNDQADVLSLIDRLQEAQKNKLQDSFLRQIQHSCARLRSKLLRYAKNPAYEIDRVFELTIKEQENTHLNRPQSIVIDINKKYDTPICQRLEQARQANEISKHKLHKQLANEFKHRSELSPNSRRMHFILQRNSKVLSGNIQHNQARVRRSGFRLSNQSQLHVSAD